MSDGSELLMLGLRGSGKTTYLAALWHYLESGEVADRLSIPLLQPDRDYLNRIRDSWLALKPVGRTSMRAHADVSLALQDKKTNAAIAVNLPDLSGETFRLQWATRKASVAYVDLAKVTTGAFLFVHPHEVRRTHVIKPLRADDGDGFSEEAGIGIRHSRTWSPQQTSSQVQLVDVLQILLGLRDVVTPMRLAIVISAWDLVKARISPNVWLEGRMPLLAQLLRANPDLLISQTFGVSAQGGDLQADRGNLLDHHVASKRCIAFEGDSLSLVNISAPLQFLLNG